MSISKIASDCAIQVMGGALIGTFLDNLFNFDTDEVDTDNAFKVGGEILIQVFANALLAGSYFDFLSRRGFQANDSIKGVAFNFTLFATQRKLWTKMGHFSEFLGRLYRKAIPPPRVPIQHPNKPGYIAVNTNPANPDVPTGQESISVPAWAQ
jgi:hypothetical protein